MKPYNKKIVLEKEGSPVFINAVPVCLNHVNFTAMPLVRIKKLLTKSFLTLQWWVIRKLFPTPHILTRWFV